LAGKYKKQKIATSRNVVCHKKKITGFVANEKKIEYYPRLNNLKISKLIVSL